MLKKEIKEIIGKSKKIGWVMEPDTQRIFSLCGLKTPKHVVVTEAKQAISMVHSIGYPVVAKIVSPTIIHKSDVKGVVVGIDNDEILTKTLERFHKLNGFTGMLIAEMVQGIELIIGAKNDFQFGPMILLGIGGIGVEIYKDVSLRMAPLKARDVDNMISGLTACRLLNGYRGAKPINMNALKKTILSFSGLMMDLQDVAESVDLNPVMCNSKSCIVADARIMLKK